MREDDEYDLSVEEEFEMDENTKKHFEKAGKIFIKLMCNIGEIQDLINDYNLNKGEHLSNRVAVSYGDSYLENSLRRNY